MKTTKRVLLTIVFFAGATVFAFSQAQFAIGIKGGPNFANLDVSSPGTSYKNRTGWHGGAFLLLKAGKIGVQPEFIFSQQGSKMRFDATDLNSNFEYINIPVMLKLYTVAGINLQLGPQFGFLTNDPKTIVDGQIIEDAYKKSDVSLGIGAGWDLPFGLTLDARYNLGLSKIEDDPSLQATKNQVWQVSVGYKLIKFGK